VCSSSNNWRASNSSLGGTAGKENSIYSEDPDEVAPVFNYFVMVAEDTLRFYFNEPLGQEFLDNIIFTVNGTAQSTSNALIEGPENNALEGPENNALRLVYNNMQAGQIYGFSLEGVADCSGNTAAIVHGRFGLPETPEAGDIILNEVLSNPYEGGSDFVEIYNNSAKVLSLKGWKIADATSGSMNTPKLIAAEDYLFFPGEYLVLTRRPEALTSLYPGLPLYTRVR